MLLGTISSQCNVFNLVLKSATSQSHIVLKLKKKLLKQIIGSETESETALLSLFNLIGLQPANVTNWEPANGKGVKDFSCHQHLSVIELRSYPSCA